MTSKQKERQLQKQKAIFKEMTNLPENKSCADCGQNGPRWASTNLGVFICIRCSGIHRNLGVHITKVKSITLDAWPEDMLAKFKTMGNAWAASVYEAKLPKSYPRPNPNDDYAVEQWIRAKYDRKEWYRNPNGDRSRSRSPRDSRYSSRGGGRSSRDRYYRSRSRSPRRRSRSRSPRRSPRRSSRDRYESSSHSTSTSAQPQKVSITSVRIKSPVTTTTQSSRPVPAAAAPAPAANLVSFDDPAPSTPSNDFGGFVSSGAPAAAASSAPAAAAPAGNGFAVQFPSAAGTTQTASAPQGGAPDLGAVFAEKTVADKKADIMNLFGPSSGGGQAPMGGMQGQMMGGMMNNMAGGGFNGQMAPQGMQGPMGGMQGGMMQGGFNGQMQGGGMMQGGFNGQMGGMTNQMAGMNMGRGGMMQQPNGMMQQGGMMMPQGGMGGQPMMMNPGMGRGMPPQQQQGGMMMMPQQGQQGGMMMGGMMGGMMQQGQPGQQRPQGQQVQMPNGMPGMMTQQLRR